MLDIKWVREHQDEVRESLRRRGADFNLDMLISLDERRRGEIQAIDLLRAQQNRASEMLESPVFAGEARANLILQSRSLKKEITEAELTYKDIDEQFLRLIHQLPNMADPEVPEGKSEADNKVVREVGEKPDFTFAPKDHVQIGEALGIIDFERGAKVAGSGFSYLKNEGVLLELALVRYALDFLREKGFTLWLTPDLARRRFYLGTGYQPRGPEAQTYEIAESDLGLIATAEVALAGLHADEILGAERLPLRYVGYSHCFRQEAGAYGKYSRGLYRQHQFTKVEMFAYTTSEDSARMHEEFLRIEEELWHRLGIPYRVVEMCAGDLGAQASRKFDLEAWMPGRPAPQGEPRPEGAGRGDWGEVTSASNTTDYQARNLNIRYRTKDGDMAVIHTLNGTAIATSRAIIAILENYQQLDGSVRIPEVLQPLMGGMKVITPKE